MTQKKVVSGLGLLLFCQQIISAFNYIAGVSATVSVTVSTCSICSSTTVSVGVSVFPPQAANTAATANKNNAFFIFSFVLRFDNSFVLTMQRYYKKHYT